MANVLVVPTKVDALFLEKDQLVQPPTADFSKLPYSTNLGDRNADVAWLSEEIVPHPFEGAALQLKAGLHLHWTLPDTFLRGTDHVTLQLDSKYVDPHYADHLPLKVSAHGDVPKDMHDELVRNGVGVPLNAIAQLVETSWEISHPYYRFKVAKKRPIESNKAVEPDVPAKLETLLVWWPGVPSEHTWNVEESFIEELDRGKVPQEMRGYLQGLYGKDARVNEAKIEKQSLWKLWDAHEEKSFATVVMTHPLPVQGSPKLSVQNKGIVFPAVPNRWLVQRRIGSEWKQWIVESDFLADAENTKEGIWYPISAEGGPPCRRLGRQQSLGSWKEGGKAEYLDRLTAVGYGDPWFASFYPSCHSVFGFYDPEIKQGTGEVQYFVTGWHSNPADDPLRDPRYTSALDSLHVKYGIGTSHSNDDGYLKALSEEALEAVHGWSAGFLKVLALTKELYEFKKKYPNARQTDRNLLDSFNNPEFRFPQRTVLASAVSLNPATMVKDSGAQNSANLAIGHTVTEALSAYAASELVNKGVSSTAPVLEDQLEALHLSSKLNELIVDIGPKFRESRHEKEFAAIDGGRRWAVVPADGATQSDNAASLNAKLTHAVKSELKELNKHEADFDRFSGVLAVQRRQLYSDWCKYMMCAYPPDGDDDYPDMDEVRAFVEACSLPAVENTRTLKREARAQRDAAYARLAMLLDSDLAGKRHGKLVIKSRPASRFWRPKEPVLLIASKDILPSTERSTGGVLQCKVVRPLELGNNLTFTGDPLVFTNDKFRHEVTISHISKQSWNPLFMDWRVKLFPVSGAENLDPKCRRYSTDFVTSRFNFDGNSADLEPKKSGVSNAPAEYQGRSILTLHGGTRLRKTIEEWMCRREKLDPAKPDDLEKARKNLRESSPVSDPICGAYQLLFDTQGTDAHIPFMAQALTGFNAALLQQRQTLQLPVADPLGFKQDRAFADRVAKAVAGENLTAPQPQREFHPIRMGALEVNELRLVGSFGQVRNLTTKGNQLITAESMSTPGSAGVPPHAALLSPRIVPPSRVKFRWLAADAPACPVVLEKANWHPSPAKAEEANDHRSALCGWIVHDRTRDGLLVHAPDGTELGRISPSGHWHSAPGPSQLAYWQIGNEHLARLVTSFVQAKPGSNGSDRTELWRKFCQDLDGDLANIIPAEFAEHDGVQLLLGRPLAVVRAQLELQVYAMAPSEQDWTAFRAELNHAFPPTTEAWGGPKSQTGLPFRRFDAGFRDVKFNFHLGDPNQLNDGLAAYWVETHSPDGRCTLGSVARPADGVGLSIAGQAVTVTMLIDPRAPVHVRSGVLPAKSIALPKGHYAEIMSQMSSALPVGPVLCPQDRIAIYAPDTLRFDVTWMEHDAGGWMEAPVTSTPSTSAEWSAPIGIREAWIKLTPKKAEQK